MDAPPDELAPLPDARAVEKPPSLPPGHVRHAVQKVVHHVQNHFGVGIICAVAYFDPGNWSVDLQAGSDFGYRPMLFVVMMAGVGAVIFQTMACRLGCVTGLDLAAHCRLLLYNRPRHRRLVRYGVMYPLYALCEIAIISTDLAELLGSAIGLCLLFPTLPLWAAVLLTATDVLVFLVLGDPSQGKGRPVRVFELTIIALVLAVFISFIVLLVKVHANWAHVFLGFVPSSRLFETSPNALYTAVGILGATVMPHALFLGSFLSTQDRVSTTPLPLPSPANASPHGGRGLRVWFRSLFAITRADRIAADREWRDNFVRPENNTLEFVHAHLGHGIVDIVTSLLGVAVPINSAILIIAASVFFESSQSASAPAGLFDAHDLIKQSVGTAAALIFALALLCAGQTASITATLAGQIVAEGFIKWRISPFLRRIVTRMIALVPSMVVAIAVGRKGIDTLLVASQVILSIVLPVVIIPLVWLTSSKDVMAVRRTAVAPPPAELEEKPEVQVREGEAVHEDEHEHVESAVPDDAASVMEENVDYSSGRFLTCLGYLICVLVVVANAYVIVELILGNRS
ncbi:natural resistance-associated macrophage protein [Auriscalpium vulgare]|uniref:Natural resistance-associated macrophage protein n=1 Tax=Auriscalpium vulgare TaxID=40419 RepID=A0ACB8S3R1_9AGAM|nr:natural resistance-associated macrophage protein [Auriscalpium vulgare]